MDHLLASVSAFMHKSSNGQLPSKKDSIVDTVANVEHPGEVCDLQGGCAPLFGVGYACACSLVPASMQLGGGLTTTVLMQAP